MFKLGEFILHPTGITRRELIFDNYVEAESFKDENQILVSRICKTAVLEHYNKSNKLYLRAPNKKISEQIVKILQQESMDH